MRSNVPLIISLCLNLLLVGLIAAAVVRMMIFQPVFAPPMGGGFGAGRGMGHGMGPMQQMMAPHVLMQAAPDKASRLHDIMEAHRARIDELRIGSLNARHDVMNAFAAPNFDQKAFDASLARVQSADAALEAEALKVLSESAAALSPDERRAAVSQQGMRGRFWRHREFQPPPDNGR